MNKTIEEQEARERKLLQAQKWIEVKHLKEEEAKKIRAVKRRKILIKTWIYYSNMQIEIRIQMEISYGVPYEMSKNLFSSELKEFIKKTLKLTMRIKNYLFRIRICPVSKVLSLKNPV